MIYWIDGYNLVFRIKKENWSVKQASTYCIAYLEEICAIFSLDMRIVFDGKAVEYKEETRSDKKHLRVIYTPYNVSADSYLIKEIASCSTPSKMVIVSSDKKVQNSALVEGIKVVDVEQFWYQLTKKAQKRKSKSNEKPERESSQKELDRLYHIFSKKKESKD